MVVGLTAAFAPAALAMDAGPTPSAPAPAAGTDAAIDAIPTPDATPSPDAIPSTDAIPGTDAAASRSINGHIDLGSAGHPATAGDVTITVFGWADNDQNQWLHYSQESHPDASGDFTLQLGQLDYVILQYDYIGPGNFVGAYSGEFLQGSDGGNPGGYHLVEPVTTAKAILAVGGSIAGTVSDAGLAPGTVISAAANPSKETPSTPLRVSAVVQSDRSYLLKGLPAGTYTVQVSGSNPRGGTPYDQAVGGTPAHPEGVSKILPSGGRVDFPSQTMSLKGVVSGHVDCGFDCLGQDRSAVSLQGFEPVSSTWVALDPPMLTVTGSEPITFTFPGSLPGTYRVAVDYLGGNNYGDLVTSPFDLHAGENKSI
ncbi:MAG: hypothetical protein JWR01_1968 [Subtercola sp.]|nr:hypothetical protein [Subtercola sp.]